MQSTGDFLPLSSYIIEYVIRSHVVGLLSERAATPLQPRLVLPLSPLARSMEDIGLSVECNID